MRCLALVVLVLVGCSQQEPPARRYEPASARQPSSQSFTFPGGTLMVLEVPLQAGRRVEMQRCFLWRSDRSELLQCAQDTEPAVPVRMPDDPPGPSERY